MENIQVNAANATAQSSSSSKLMYHSNKSCKKGSTNANNVLMNNSSGIDAHNQS